MTTLPDVPSLESAADRLRNELSALIESIDELRSRIGPLLAARYQAALGRLELQLLELQIEVQSMLSSANRSCCVANRQIPTTIWPSSSLLRAD